MVTRRCMAITCSDAYTIGTYVSSVVLASSMSFSCVARIKQSEFFSHRRDIVVKSVTSTDDAVSRCSRCSSTVRKLRYCCML